MDYYDIMAEDFEVLAKCAAMRLAHVARDPRMLALWREYTEGYAGLAMVMRDPVKRYDLAIIDEAVAFGPGPWLPA